MFGRTGAPTQRGPTRGSFPFLTCPYVWQILTLTWTLIHVDGWRHSIILAVVNTFYPARFPQCSWFQKTAEKLVSKYIRLLPACGSTGMLTCRWGQLCVRRRSDNWVLRRGRAPHIFRTGPHLDKTRSWFSTRCSRRRQTLSPVLPSWWTRSHSVVLRTTCAAIW